MLHTSFSTFLSGLTTFGVPEPLQEGNASEAWESRDLAVTKTSGKRVDHTFEALVQAPGPLEQLVEVRPAVEHSLKGIVICKLKQGTVSNILVRFAN